MHRVGEDRRGAGVGYSRIMPNRQLVRAIRLLVMHGNRILDVADRITHLEGGRLSWFTTAVTANTQHRMDLLAQPNRQGELLRHVAGMSVDQVARPLVEATAECEQVPRVAEMCNTEAFESMRVQTVEACVFHLGEVLAADRASLPARRPGARRAVLQDRPGRGRPAARLAGGRTRELVADGCPSARRCCRGGGVSDPAGADARR